MIFCFVAGWTNVCFSFVAFLKFFQIVNLEKMKESMTTKIVRLSCFLLSRIHLKKFMNLNLNLNKNLQE